MPLLDVRGLEKTYGHRKVVAGVDFHVDEGEIVGLLGPNGAGKTTCFRMTCGMIEPDKGKIFLGGDDVTNWPMYRRARDGGMGYLAQESSVFRKLSVEQNLLGMMELLGLGPIERRQRCEELLDQFQIEHIRKSKAARLSGGERRRLEIARCLVSDPDIILLDEPFAGIDPLQVQSIQGLIRDLRQRNISVLITDHAARELLQIADRSYVISGGVVLFHGTPPEVISNERVRQIYLGEAIEAGPTDSPASPSPPPAPHRPPATRPGEKRPVDKRAADNRAPERPGTVPISRRPS